MNILKQIWQAFVDWIGEIQTIKNNAETAEHIEQAKREAMEDIAALDEYERAKRLEDLYRD